MTEKPTKKPIQTLFIEADEDHVAYQDGTNRFMKLVYVHEGYTLMARLLLIHDFKSFTDTWNLIGEYFSSLVIFFFKKIFMNLSPIF